MLIPVTVNLVVGLEPEGIEKLMRAMQDDAAFGMHMVNTLVNHAHVDAAQFRGLSLDITPVNG